MSCSREELEVHACAHTSIQVEGVCTCTSWDNRSFYTCTTPIVLKARHLAKWLCLLLGLGLPEQAMALGLGLLAEGKPRY